MNKIKKGAAYACCLSVLICGGFGGMKQAHAFVDDRIYGYEDYEMQNALIDRESALQLYDDDDFATERRSHYLFEQSGGRKLGAEYKYFESDRLKLTHDYGGDVVDGRVESFHTILRLSLSF